MSSAEGWDNEGSYDKDQNGYRRYHGNEDREYTVEKQPCPNCKGTGRIFYPHAAGPGEFVPCACTQEGQRFWDKV